MKFNWKQDLWGLILLGLMILGISVPVGIMGRQYNRINELEQEKLDMERGYYDDILEYQEEIFYFELRYRLKEQELNLHKQYALTENEQLKREIEQIMDDWDDSIEVVIAYYESGSTLTLEEYFQVNHAALYARIMGYNW